MKYKQFLDLFSGEIDVLETYDENGEEIEDHDNLIDELDVIGFKRKGGEFSVELDFSSCCKCGGKEISAFHNKYGVIVFRRVSKLDRALFEKGGAAIYFMRDTISGHEFDAVEALCACPNGLKAGTYHDGDYSFTLEKDLLPGSVIVYHIGQDTGWNIKGVRVYQNIISRNPIAEYDVTGGKDGTALSEAVGAENVNYDPKRFNDTKWRTRYGSGNYAQSAIHKWLTSRAEAGEWWYPSTPFDRPPSYVDEPGFLAGFDEEFLEKLVVTDQICATNNVYEVGYERNTWYFVPSVMFLPSYSQLTGQRNNGVMENVQWDEMDGVYEEACENYACDRLQKKDMETGKSSWYWQRSCNSDIPEYAGIVDDNGYPWSSVGAANPFSGFAAACTIRES